MAYKILLTNQAVKDLRALNQTLGRRIIKKIQWWEAQENPLVQAKPLREPAAGDYRFRVGDYRLIVLVDERKKTIYIIRIGHRREVYL